MATITYVPQLADVYAEKRWSIQRVYDNFLALIREIQYGVQIVYNRVNDWSKTQYDRPDISKTWTAESKGLCVLIHGLRGHPSIWEPQLKILRKEKNIDLFVPYVSIAGDGSIEEAARPLLQQIQDFATKHPDKPICLMGVSNGGRLCTYIETQLRDISSASVMVSTIAAVHFGTSRMNWVKWLDEWTGFRFGYRPRIVNDLCFGSDKAKEILSRVADSTSAPREYEFFATTEDTNVPEIVSSMPNVGPHSCKRDIVHGYGHNSIVAGVAAKQIESFKKWMEKFIV
jgi:hypothetical protein